MKSDRVRLLLLKVAVLALSMFREQMYAQTDSAYRFFPLNVGDIHQFNYHFPYHYGPGCDSSATHSSYHIEQIIGDTIMPNGHKYVHMTSNMPGEEPDNYLRFDSLTANIFHYSTSTLREYLWDSLRARAGDSFARDSVLPIMCMRLDTEFVFGVETITKRYSIGLVPPQYYSLSFGFGRTHYEVLDQENCLPIVVSYQRDLRYARIQGTEYGTIVSVAGARQATPFSIQLAQNYPNPFNPSTSIDIILSRPDFVRLEIFNVLGVKIATLVAGRLGAGVNRFVWDASEYSSGVYFYQAEVGSERLLKRMLLLK